MMRTARRFLTALVLVLALCWLAAQARMRVFRHRAEALLPDIQALQLNQSTWADAQTLMHRWGAYGSYYDACTPEECHYYIRLDDEIFNYPDFVYARSNQVVARFLDPFGIRASGVISGFGVAHGRVVDKSYLLEVALPARLWTLNEAYWPSLAAEFSESSDLMFFAAGDHARYPNHSVRQIRILLRSSFTPKESPAIQQALMDLRFRCVTSFRPCLDRAEISPEAEREWKARVNDPSVETCYPTLRLRAREADEVLLVQAVAATPPRPDQQGPLVEVKAVLKGARKVQPGDLLELALPLAPGSPPFPTLLVTGRIDSWPSQHFSIRPDPCGLAEPTPANLQQAH